MSSLAELPELVGFFSYSREDDDDSHGALSALRDRIQRELRGQLGRSMKTFRLWQDKEAIASGTLWESEITNAVAQSAFFIPIITPTVVRSPYCRFELESFLAREVALGRSDLVFPILYIRVQELENEERRRNDPVLSIIAKRQYLDWRDFRHRDVSSTDVRTAIERFCASICDALHRHWTSPEDREREEAAARARAEAERKREEAAARERAEAERKREEAAARERAETERKREEAAARERAEAERKREEAAARERAEAERKREQAAASEGAEAQAAACKRPEPEGTGEGATPVESATAKRRSAPIEPSTDQAAQWRFGPDAARAAPPSPPAGMARAAKALLIGGAIAAIFLVITALISPSSKVEEPKVAPLPSLPPFTPLTPLPPLASVEWPMFPVTVAVGAAHGSTSDLVAREVAESLSPQIGKAVTVYNQPGEFGNAAAWYAKMTLSGDTLLLLTTAHAVNMSVNKNPGFDVLTDFVAIAGIAEMPLLMLVSPSVPAKSLSEFVAYAKAHRTSVRMGLAPFPGNPRLPIELFMMLTGLNLPLVSSGASISSSGTLQDLIAGKIQLAFAIADRATLDLVGLGKLRVLAVTTKHRHDAFPGVPAAAESIPGFEASVWSGLGAPRTTSEADVETMRRKIPGALADPTLKSRLAPLGMTVIAEGPAEFGRRVASEVEKWDKVVRTRGIGRY